MLDSHDSGHKVGHYTAGWIKRGPSGVIGTNKKDALETVRHLLADVESQTLLEPANPAPEAVEAAARRAAASATSPSRTGRRSTRPRSAAASPTAVPGSSSSASRRCSTRSARASAEPDGGRPGRAEGDDRGGAARRRGRGLRRRRRRPAPAAVVTAPQFEGLSRIEQHRLVKAAVKPRFDDGTVHALSVKTRPPERRAATVGRRKVTLPCATRATFLPTLLAWRQ